MPEMTLDRVPSDCRSVLLPFDLVPNPSVDLISRAFIAGVMAFVIILLLLAATAIWIESGAGKSVGALIFILTAGGIMLAGCLAAIRYLHAGSSLILVVTKESLWLGSREVSWSRITGPAIEEIEQEGAPSEYQVTFCIVGDRIFGTWHHFNPRSYVTAHEISAAEADDILCNCLCDARRRALASEFKESAASMPVHESLRVEPSLKFA